jgi:hypothetical protein
MSFTFNLEAPIWLQTIIPKIIPSSHFHPKTVLPARLKIGLGRVFADQKRIRCQPGFQQ